MRRTEHTRALRFLGSALVFACASGASSAAAVTVNKVTVEAVDHYADGSGSIVCIAEVDNFVNSIVSAPGSIWKRGLRFTDSCGGGASAPCSSVWDTDFADPDRPGATSFDNDTQNFDRAGDAVSFVSVHGICNDVSNTSCTSTAACGANKVCIGPGPAGGAGWCASYQDRKLYVGLGAGSHNHHGGFIDYSNGMMALGEDATYGSWGRASTNGGVNFAAVVNSCGVRPGFIIQETWQMFAGVQNIGMVMPVTP